MHWEIIFSYCDNTIDWFLQIYSHTYTYSDCTQTCFQAKITVRMHMHTHSCHKMLKETYKNPNFKPVSFITFLYSLTALCISVSLCMVQLHLNLITRVHYRMSTTTFLSSVWSQTRILG